MVLFLYQNLYTGRTTVTLQNYGQKAAFSMWQILPMREIACQIHAGHRIIKDLGIDPGSAFG
jgi:hypothetical protein